MTDQFFVNILREIVAASVSAVPICLPGPISMRLQAAVLIAVAAISGGTSFASDSAATPLFAESVLSRSAGLVCRSVDKLSTEDRFDALAEWVLRDDSVRYAGDLNETLTAPVLRLVEALALSGFH